MTNVVFELYRPDGTLQIELGAALPQTLGVIYFTKYPGNAGSVYVPEWEGNRHWFYLEGTMTPAYFWNPVIRRSGNNLVFDGPNIRGDDNPRIKYGIY